jgi:hypothetical protein
VLTGFYSHKGFQTPLRRIRFRRLTSTPTRRCSSVARLERPLCTLRWIQPFRVPRHSRRSAPRCSPIVLMRWRVDMRMPPRVGMASKRQNVCGRWTRACRSYFAPPFSDYAWTKVLTRLDVRDRLSRPPGSEYLRPSSSLNHAMRLLEELRE